jgi:6-phosphogluconolactonase
MQIEVYPTDADAADAAAAMVAERLRAAPTAGRAIAAVGGGRTGRATLVALATRGDLPWASVDWCLADERCGEAGDPVGHAKVARDSLFTPRGVASGRIHAPVLDGGDAETVAARYAARLTELLGPEGRLDVVVLGVGADGALGALTSGAPALDAAAWIAVVPATTSGEPPRVAMTPALLARARHVVVTAVGPETAGAVAAALRDGQGPAARVLPSERVTWVVDRDAAGLLLKGATAVPAA